LGVEKTAPETWHASNVREAPLRQRSSDHRPSILNTREWRIPDLKAHTIPCLILHLCQNCDVASQLTQHLSPGGQHTLCDCAANAAQSCAALV